MTRADSLIWSMILDILILIYTGVGRRQEAQSGQDGRPNLEPDPRLFYASIISFKMARDEGSFTFTVSKLGT